MHTRTYTRTHKYVRTVSAALPLSLYKRAYAVPPRIYIYIYIYIYANTHI